MCEVAMLRHNGEPTDPELHVPINFAEAARFINDTFKGRRGGRRLNVSTLHRWALHGIRGQRLECWSCGGTRFTNRSAILSFFERCALARNGGSALIAETSSLQRVPLTASDRRHVVAERKLDEAGV
jgi:hypothetical protein